MTTDMSNFKATILKDVGVVNSSPDIEHRVLIVRDEDGKIKVSAQAWWRDFDNVLKPGKGYFVTGRRALQLAKAIGRARGTLAPYEETMSLSNTQKYIIWSKSSIVSIDKWWRKDEGEEWTLGKSLAIDRDKADQLENLLLRAGASIVHIK